MLATHASSPRKTLPLQTPKRYRKPPTTVGLYYQGDFTTMASYYTEDAQLMVEGREMFQGREAIEQFWQAVCQLAGTMTRAIEVLEIQASGDLGYMRSRVTTRARTGEQAVLTISKDIAIWRRGNNGAWQLYDHAPAPFIPTLLADQGKGVRMCCSCVKVAPSTGSCLSSVPDLLIDQLVEFSYLSRWSLKIKGRCIPLKSITPSSVSWSIRRKVS